MRLFIISFVFFPFLSFAQSIPKDVNVIIVKDVGFLEVCNALLDSGYTISKKDNELQTVSTESKAYPKLWNATYKINIRVKDSTAYISGTFTAAGGEIWKDDPIKNQTNRKGKTYPKSINGYPFLILNNFAQSFKKEITYSISN
ncbi:MAG: hypothetical protein WAU23_09235 [Ferruginibacter sp.]